MPPAKRRINGHSKGSTFERKLCRLLSLWWTGGEQDDVFWRSAGSGGMAKRRGRAGKKTHGQHGDIMAVDPVGAPLLEVFTIEMKKGYSKFTPFDAFDRMPARRPSTFEQWVQQARESAMQADSHSWLIIFQRNNRQAVVALRTVMIKQLAPRRAFPQRVEMSDHCTGVVMVRLDDFLRVVTPDNVRKLLEA